MKSTIVLLACFSLLGTVLTFRNLRIFTERIDVERCLGRLPGSNAYAQYEPVGYTLESFITLVEKIEYHHPQMNIFELTNMILERFYFPNVYFKQVSGQRKPSIESESRYNLLRTLLPSKNPNSQEELFREEELTEDEKCSLYFMIAHNINNTYRGSIDDPKITTSPDSAGSSQQGNKRERIHPREQGVVSLHSDPISAVAIGRVLVGIAAGEFKDMKITLANLPGYTKDMNRERELEVLTALTVGDAIASAEHESEFKHKLQTTKYGPPGEWNSTTCPIDYTLTAMNTSTTDAELRGSIDGYIIGNYVKRLHDNMQDQLKLSRLIRMYYSGRGMRIGSETIGFCFRSSQAGLQDQMVYSTAETVFIYLSSSVEVDEKLLEEFRKNLKDYNEYLSGLHVLTNGRSKGYHGEYNICTRITTDKQAEYDTPVDLFVVLDVTEHNTKGIQDQVDVVGHLAGHMDIGNGAGSVTVLLNTRGGQVFIKNETNSACATCQMTRMDLRNAERDNLASVLELLNRTLKEYEESRRYEAAVPAKAVIFFHYDTTVDEDINRLKEAKRILSYGHRDVHVFAVGTNADVLDYIATDKSTKFTEVLEPVKLADRIREEIKKVPATLQYHECGKPRSKVEDNHYYTGYVTPNTKQMWAMYPEYFLKSYNIEFRFKADANSGKIKVCYDRDNYDPSLNDKKSNNWCRESENNGQDIKFTMANPCDGQTRDNCRPFYFSVEGLDKDVMDLSQSCNDANCRRTDQIKFTVSHKGVACSGALGLLASPLILLAVIYATLKHL